jgi:hypothetical protein
LRDRQQGRDVNLRIATPFPVKAGLQASALFGIDADYAAKVASPPAGAYPVTVTETNPNAASPYATGIRPLSTS